MKKLMIVAAAGAMTLASEAAYKCTNACSDEGCGAVYKIAISLKTTAPKIYGASKCIDDCAFYRKQASMKINGYIWGEGACDECSLELPENLNLWTKNGPVETDLHIVVGQINKNGDKLEAHGDLGGSGDSWGWLKLAGFGSIAASKTKDACDECGDPTIVGYVKSLAGGIAGWRAPDETDCAEPEYNCAEQLENTAAYGTWKIAYNASLSKKLACSEDQDLTTLIKYPSAAYVDGEIITTAVDTDVEE